MKAITTTAICALLLAGLSTAEAAAPRQQRQRQQQNLQPGNVRPNGALRPAFRRALLQDAIYSFYVKQFQQDPDMSPEVFTKILPFVNQFLQDRFDISERRTRALNQLKQAINRNASEDELKQFSREIDNADSEFQANHQKFLNNVDPLLNGRQQAKMRILQNAADNRIRQMLETLQNTNNPPRQTAPER